MNDSSDRSHDARLRRDPVIRVPVALSETLQSAVELPDRVICEGVIRQPVPPTLNGNQMKGFPCTIPPIPNPGGIGCPRRRTCRRMTHEHLIDCSGRKARTTLSNTHAPATPLRMYKRGRLERSRVASLLCERQGSLVGSGQGKPSYYGFGPLVSEELGVPDSAVEFVLLLPWLSAYVLNE